MDWRLFIAWRYFRIKKKERFISALSLISIAGVAVGVAALLVVISVMSGFDHELKTRIVGTTPHITIERDGGILYPDESLERNISSEPYVNAVSPYVSGQALITHERQFSGTLITGLPPAGNYARGLLEMYLTEGRLFSGDKEIVLGSELARILDCRIGDNVSLVSAHTGTPRFFTVSGIAESGLYTFDANNAFIALEVSQALFGAETRVTGYAVRLSDVFRADEVRDILTRDAGIPYRVRSWTETNRTLFGALRLEKITMFIILTLIIIVACFNIAGMLIVRVVEKTKDIGILKSLGARPGDIAAVFHGEGLCIGLIGTGIGAGVGLCISWVQKTFKVITLPRDIYYIDALPVALNWRDVTIVITCAVLLSLLATLYPSVRAARLHVVDALRYE